MDPKAETIAAYDAYAERFDEEYERHLRRYNLPHARAFMQALPGRSVLDIGAGPGNHAALFAAEGLGVLCGDVSTAMLEICRRKGLRTAVLDLETFELPDRFDGIWANACLLHLPKAAVPDAVARCARHLRPRGVFACAVKEGGGERIEEDADYPGVRRRFSYFSPREIEGLLAPWFDIEARDRTPTRTGRAVFIKFVARARS